MKVSLEIGWVEASVLLIGLLSIFFGAARAIGWIPKRSKLWEPDIVWVLFGMALIFQQLGNLENEAGEQIFEGWGFVLYAVSLLMGLRISWLARPESLKEELKEQSQQMIRDFRRMYGPTSNDTKRSDES